VQYGVVGCCEGVGVRWVSGEVGGWGCVRPPGGGFATRDCVARGGSRTGCFRRLCKAGSGGGVGGAEARCSGDGGIESGGLAGVRGEGLSTKEVARGCAVFAWRFCFFVIGVNSPENRLGRHIDKWARDQLCVLKSEPVRSQRILLLGETGNRREREGQIPGRFWLSSYAIPRYSDVRHDFLSLHN